MLNARTLAQASTAEETTGSADVMSEAAAAPANEAEGTTAAAPLRPVEAFQTREGVVVLSNRPAGEAAPAQNEPAAAAAEPPPAQPMVLTPSPGGAREAAPAAGVGSPGLWLLVAGLALAITIAAAALLLARRKRRRTTARYAALLAGSEPIAPAPDHVGPFARHATSSPYTRSPATSTPSPASARGAASRTPLPSSATRDEPSSPQSAPPPSGISAPPVSERQWLSQRPPRSYKQPPS